MRYLEENEILAYINAGKEVEQFLGEYMLNGFKCFRYVSLGKSKEGYYGLLFEKFDDSGEGLVSIYDYSSVEPDELNGKEVGPYESLGKLITSVNNVIKLNPRKYLISGNLDSELKIKS